MSSTIIISPGTTADAVSPVGSSDECCKCRFFLPVKSLIPGHITFTSMAYCWKTKSYSIILKTSWYGSLIIIKYTLSGNLTLLHTSNTVHLWDSKISWLDLKWHFSLHHHCSTWWIDKPLQLISTRTIWPRVHYVIAGDLIPRTDSYRSKHRSVTDRLGPCHGWTGSLKRLHLDHFITVSIASKSEA